MSLAQAVARLPLCLVRAAERSPVALAAARNPAAQVVAAHKPVDPAGARRPADPEVEDMPVVPAAAHKPADPRQSQRNSAAVARLPSGSDWDCWPGRKTVTKKNTRQETRPSQCMSRGE